MTVVRPSTADRTEIAGVIMRIAVEQRGREDAEHDDAAGPFLLAAERAVDEREQREASALALVVGAHDDRDVFQRHDDHHRPEDQAQHAVDVQLVGNERVMAGEGLAERVDRRRADIAEDDSDRADRQLVQRPVGVAVRIDRSAAARLRRPRLR